MAGLDVSEVIRDPLFTSPVTLIPRTETVDDLGNPAWADGERVSCLLYTSPSPRD